MGGGGGGGGGRGDQTKADYRLTGGGGGGGKNWLKKADVIKERSLTVDVWLAHSKMMWQAANLRSDFPILNGCAAVRLSDAGATPKKC